MFNFIHDQIQCNEDCSYGPRSCEPANAAQPFTFLREGVEENAI
jgi:hypothetical protein